jgi:peptidyl-prolyl cis-trans isomerase D
MLEQIDPKLLAYEDVKDKIAVKLTAGLQKQAARKAAESMLEKSASDAESLEKLAADNQLKVESSEMFTRNDAVVPGITGSEAIAQAAFALDEKNPVYKEVLEASGKFYIIALKERQTPDAATIADNLDNVKQQLETRKQRDYYSQWLATRKEKADILINTDIIN